MSGSQVSYSYIITRKIIIANILNVTFSDSSWGTEDKLSKEK
jgi:ribosomal protein L28